MSLIAGNLGVVQRLLDSQGMAWAVFAGAAAHLYGNRRPIQDVDVLVQKGQLPLVVKLMQSSGKAVQFDGQRILWRGIKLFDDLTIRRPGASHPLVLDTPMQEHFRRLSLLGAPVMVMAPEDVVAHKLLLGRGPTEGKHDIADVEAILRRQTLDTEYLQARTRLLNAEALLAERLAALGVAVA
jgi:hypothetical protein